MKMQFVNLTIFSSLFLSLIVQAATPTPELKVKGSIGVPTCTINVPDGGVYNVGNISAATIQPTTSVILPTITKTWTISCDGSTYLSFTPTDNRKSSVSNTTAIHNFGLGFVNGTGKIGYFRTGLSNAKVDGESSFFYYVENGFQGGHTTETLTNNLPFGWAQNATTAKAGKVFSADLTVTPVLASSATMGGAITENINIDGSVTLSFAYGI
ncbi:DUF1120 domain-containing protein [Yersinia enterocolitica]